MRRWLNVLAVVSLALFSASMSAWLIGLNFPAQYRLPTPGYTVLLYDGVVNVSGPNGGEGFTVRADAHLLFTGMTAIIPLVWLYFDCRGPATKRA